MSKPSAAKGSGKYNVVVIGAGTAGLVTAAGTAALGGRVALIERNRMGGDCLNYGCVPSKALISSARLLHDMRRGAAFGLAGIQPKFEFERVFERMRGCRTQIAPNDSQARFESLGVDVFRGNARFKSAHEIDVDGVSLRAKNFVIATGSRAAVPAISGLGETDYFTNETIFDGLKKKPKSLLILGGGPIGCELAQAFQRLEVPTTLIQSAPQLLPKEDPDAAAFLRARLEGEGVRVLCASEAQSFTRRQRTIHASIAEKRNGGSGLVEVQVEQVLVAAGRTPNVDDLGLDAAGVRFTPKGVEVNSSLQTSQPHIFAAGDVVGPYQFTHMADYQARIVVRNILLPFARTRVDYSVVPWCTYVDPEIARVGWNESEAKKKGIPYKLFRLELRDVDRAVLSAEEEGFVKVLTAERSDKILGVTLVAAHAGDLIHEFVLAMKFGIGLGKISSTIHAYPTLAELARKMGDQQQRTRLTPAGKKLFAWLYRRARR